MIGLLCSVEKEASLFIKEIGNKRISYWTNLKCVTGKINNKKIVLLISGVGKVNAAHGASVLINRFNTELIINFGIAGAFPKTGLSIGDIVLSEEEVYADEGIELARGFSDMSFIGIPLIRDTQNGDIYNKIPVDKGLLSHIRRNLEKYGIRCNSGRFITLSTITGTREKADYLWRRFNPLCENMEGAAIAHIATLYKSAFVELRGISNYVGKRDKSTWDIDKAVKNCTKALLRTLEIL